MRSEVAGRTGIAADIKGHESTREAFEGKSELGIGIGSRVGKKAFRSEVANGVASGAEPIFPYRGAVILEPRDRERQSSRR